MQSSVVLETQLDGLTLSRRGKVRDVYDLGSHLLIVATDRISAFDYILGSGIPDKGKVLTQLSAFWFDHVGDLIPHHVVAVDVDQFPAVCRPHRDVLRGRSMLVRKTEPLPVECVARGYISGSGWKDYKTTGAVCGITLPAGLRESDRLPEALFTPATKAESGHDENISEAQAGEIVGAFEEQMRRVAFQMSRGETIVQDVGTLSEQARQALDLIVEATESAATGASRIALTSREQELEFAKLSERVRRIASISGRNRDGAEQVTTSAREQAAALRELEGATQELRNVATYLGELTRRITNAV